MAHKRGRTRGQDWFFPKKINIPKADDRCGSCGLSRGQNPRNSCCKKWFHNMYRCYICKNPGKPRIPVDDMTGIYCDNCWNNKLLVRKIKTQGDIYD